MRSSFLGRLALFDRLVDAKALCAELAQKRRHAPIGAFDHHCSILPRAVLLHPSAARRITLILVNVVHPLAIAERLAEHEDSPRPPEHRFELTKGVVASAILPVHPARSPLATNADALRRGAEPLAPIEIERPGCLVHFDAMPPIRTRSQLRRPFRRQLDKLPLKTVMTMLAVEIDHAAIYLLPTRAKHPAGCRSYTGSTIRQAHHIHRKAA